MKNTESHIKPANGSQQTPSCPSRKKIGEILVENGLINENQLDRALLYQYVLKQRGEKPLLGTIFVELEILTANQLLKFITRHKVKVPMGELLLLEQKITKEQFKTAMNIQEKDPSKRLGDILLNELKVISPETFVRTIAKQNDMSRIKPQVSELDPNFFFSFQETLLLEHNFIPYRLFQTDPKTYSCVVIVAVPSAELLGKIKTEIRKKSISMPGNGDTPLSKCDITFALALKDEISSFIKQAFQSREAISYSKKIEVESIEKDEILTIGTEYYSSNSNLNIFIKMMIDAIDSGASDVHIEPTRDKLRVRFRIDGVLIKQPDLPKALNNYFVRGLKNYFKIKDSHLVNVVVDDRKRVYYKDKGIYADLRISIIPVIYGDKMAIRVLLQSKEVPTFEKLGMCKNIIKKYKLVCSMSSGIVIVTGPTSSGKTTTLFSTLDYLSTDEINILTIEDPPEYLIEGVNQTKVSGDKGRELSYSDALKSALRQDPDVIMFGEMRDYESASVALTAGLTGHLLFTTLHTNDAASAITRLFDMDIRPYLLSSTLVSIMAQRLVRLICPACKVEYDPDQQMKGFFRLFFSNFDEDVKDGKIKFFHGVGCEQCNDSGYKGRIAIHELLCVNDDIRREVLKGVTARDAELIARTYGMTSMIEDGFLKVIKGLTTVDEVLRVSKTLESPEKIRSVAEIRELLEGDITQSEILASVYSAKHHLNSDSSMFRKTTKNR